MNKVSSHFIFHVILDGDFSYDFDLHPHFQNILQFHLCRFLLGPYTLLDEDVIALRYERSNIT